MIMRGQAVEKMLDTAGYSVLTHIYDAAMNRTRWHDALDAVAELCGVPAAALLIRHPDAHLRDFQALSSNLSTASRSPWGVFFGMRQGNVHTADWDKLRHVEAGQPFLDTAFGNTAQFLDQRADYRFLKRRLKVQRRVGVRMNADAAWLEAMGVGLPEGQNDLTDAARRALSTLVPHMTKAVESARMYEALRTRHHSVLGALNHLLVGAAVVRQTGEVITANREALRIFEQDKGLRQTSNGHLRCHLPRQTARLHAAFVEAAHTAAGLGLRPAFEIDITQPEDAPPLLAEIIPLRDSFGELNAEAEAALMIVIDPARADKLSTGRFAVSYGLSRPETQLCVALVSGQSHETIAQEYSIQPDALDTRVNALMRTIGVQDQNALLRRVVRVAPPVT